MKKMKGQVQGTKSAEHKTDYTAWMLRDDRKAIPCVQHIYGSDDIEETLYASEWLYENTARPQTRQLILEFLSFYAISLNIVSSLEETLRMDARGKPYVTLSAGFVEKIGKKLFPIDSHLEQRNSKVCEALNDEFMRVRYGGLYNTVKGCEEIYFRISSKKPAWPKVITAFLGEVAFSIENVTVVYDEESTGTGECCRGSAGEELDHVPYVPGMEIGIDYTR